MGIYKDTLSYNDGVYIELGAFDGHHWSNTKWLQDELNWKGILIEPSPKGYDACLINRPNDKIFNCVCVSPEYKNPTIQGDFTGHPMSSISGTRLSNIGVKHELITVPARTLQSIIEESGYNNIDFLSLDVEGYEFDVLKGIDFTKTKIKYMLIEVYEKDKNDIFSFLKNLGYDCVENVTDFNLQNNPNWDGTHNDYFFVLNLK